jgi:hypothetical protein
MDYRKIADESLADDLRDAQNEPAAKVAAEIRLLNDLELVLASGGEIVPTWP